MKKENPLARCIAVVGTQSELARQLSTNRQTISEWKYRGCIPRRWIRKLYALTKIPIEDLLLDWDPETQKILPPPKSSRPSDEWGGARVLSI